MHFKTMGVYGRRRCGGTNKQDEQRREESDERRDRVHDWARSDGRLKDGMRMMMEKSGCVCGRMAGFQPTCRVPAGTRTRRRDDNNKDG